MTVKPWSFVPVGRISPGWWVLVVLALIPFDYLSGPYFQFPAVYVIPVTLAAWFSGAATGLALAIVFPLTRLTMMHTVFGLPWDSATIIASAVTRATVFSIMAIVAARLADHERAMSREVKALQSLLPICAYCRKIRDDDGDAWAPLDDYVARHQADFPPGLCPHCAQARFPEHFLPPPAGA